MFDEWGISSNFLSCYPIDQSSFYPDAEYLAQQCPKENFHFDSTIIASALFPTPSSKRQSLESSPVHDIQNYFGIFGDSTSPSPLQLPLNESTIRSLNLQECASSSQTSSLEYNPFETPNSSQSQLSYSLESDKIKPECLFTESYGTPVLPATQLLSKDMKSQHQLCQNSLGARGIIVDQLKKTEPSESVFGGLSHPGICPNDMNTPIIGTSGVSRPSIPFVAHSPIELNDQFSNSPSTYGEIRPPAKHKENKSLADGREIDKKNGTSGRKDSTKMKRFPCPECGQKFARAFNLQTHIATHAGTRPFSCPADGCFKAFSRRHDLGRHITAVHHQWLAIKNLSVPEAIKSLHWKKNKNSCHVHRNRAKHHQT